MSDWKTAASNAWHRAAGRRIQGTRQQLSNWCNRKAIQRGRRGMPARAADQVRSRTPVVRDRVNPATGRPHRDDVRLGRGTDRSLRQRQPVTGRGHAPGGRSR